MAFGFGKKKNQPVKMTDSLIGQGGTLEGKVHCDTNLRIEGAFSGEIRCSKTVTVGEHGLVRSSIAAEDVIIAGKVFGHVTAGKRLIMTASGHLYGDVTAKSLSVEQGAHLSGNVAMIEEAAPDQGTGTASKEKEQEQAKGQDSRAQQRTKGGREAG